MNVRFSLYGTRIALQSFVVETTLGICHKRSLLKLTLHRSIVSCLICIFNAPVFYDFVHDVITPIWHHMLQQFSSHISLFSFDKCQFQTKKLTLQVLIMYYNDFAEAKYILENN